MGRDTEALRSLVLRNPRGQEQQLGAGTVTQKIWGNVVGEEVCVFWRRGLRLKVQFPVMAGGSRNG